MRHSFPLTPLVWEPLALGLPFYSKQGYSNDVLWTLLLVASIGVDQSVHMGLTVAKARVCYF
jgi:hypothetical protein